MSNRYDRQLILPEIGEKGQARLAAARVLVIGAGGLGCPIISYLAGAGVGQLTIVDPDHVEMTNLHRQPLYGPADVGLPKAERAVQWIEDFNPDVKACALVERLDPANAGVLVTDADIVVDAADSFAATYILSDACADGNTPLVTASVLGMSGYAGVFCGGAPSYRAVFPELPDQVQTCNTAGVMGPAVALLGALQAQMVMALILRLEPGPLGRLVTADVGSFSFGGFNFDGACEPDNSILSFISAGSIKVDDQIVELRDIDEAPVAAHPAAVRMTPLGVTDWQPRKNARIILCCRSGLRAWRAARQLQNRGFHEIALMAVG